MARTLGTTSLDQATSGTVARLHQQRVMLRSPLLPPVARHAPADHRLGAHAMPPATRRRVVPTPLAPLSRPAAQKATTVCTAPAKLSCHGNRPRLGRRLGHRPTDQIVGQQMCPDFLTHHLRRLAPQDAHLHRRLERPQIQLDLPAIMPPKRETCSRPRLALRHACRSLLKPLPCYFTSRFFGVVNSVGMG